MKNTPCPRCELALHDGQAGGVRIKWCSTCQGYLLNKATFKKNISPEALKEYEEKYFHLTNDSELSCPYCQSRMGKVVLEKSDGIEIDICKTCQFIWLDKDEITLKLDKLFSKKLRIALAKQEVENHQVRLDPWDNKLNERDEAISAIGDVPIKRRRDVKAVFPLVTYALIGFCLLVYAFGLFLPYFDLFYPTDGNYNFLKWMVSPLTVFIFKPVEVFNLIFTLYFALTLGEDIENDLGLINYFLLLITVTILSTWPLNLVYFATGLTNLIKGVYSLHPIICSMLIYYAMRFPKTKFTSLLFFTPQKGSVNQTFSSWFLLLVYFFPILGGGFIKFPVGGGSAISTSIIGLIVGYCFAKYAKKA